MDQVNESADLTKQVWWVNLLRGILILTFGFAVLAWPGMTVTLLMVLFGIYLLADGVFEMIKGLSSIKTQKGWYWDLVRGIFSLVAGVFVLNNPGISTLTLVIFIGAVFFVSGLFDIISMFDKNVIGNKALRFISGILGIIAGLTIMVYPVKGGLAFLWVVGVYALVMGPILIVLSFAQKAEEAKALK